MSETPCNGCKHLVRKWRGIFPRFVCKLYKKPAEVKCIDWRG